jgi:hypothetical protein
VYGGIFIKEQPDVVALAGMTVIVVAAAIPYIQHYNSQKGTIEN